MSPKLILRLPLALLLGLPLPVFEGESGIFCLFKGEKLALTHPMRPGPTHVNARSAASIARLDTLSNWHSPTRRYVEIVRQDDPHRPRIGIALGFEFDENNGEYPYTPAHAVLQVKDFGWGGVEFSRRDTMNYTGVSNAVSDDLHIEVTDFRNDSIFGHFSGLLISGAGPMAPIERGEFAVRLYRMD